MRISHFQSIRLARLQQQPTVRAPTRLPSRSSSPEAWQPRGLEEDRIAHHVRDSLLHGAEGLQQGHGLEEEGTCVAANELTPGHDLGADRGRDPGPVQEGHDQRYQQHPSISEPTRPARADDRNCSPRTRARMTSCHSTPSLSRTRRSRTRSPRSSSSCCPLSRRPETRVSRGRASRIRSRQRSCRRARSTRRSRRSRRTCSSRRSRAST